MPAKRNITKSATTPEITPDLMAAFAAFMASQAETPEAPATPKEKVAATTAKAKLTRNLDPVIVAADDGRFRVVASTYSGGVLKAARGAVMRGEDGDSVEKSLTRESVEWIVDHADAILKGFDTVEKRARIGSYAPKAEA